MGSSIRVPITCPVCGISLNRREDLKRHMPLHSPNKEDLKHPCTYPGCSFRTLQLSNLRTHYNKHTGLRPHKCRTKGCTFTTSDPSRLTSHRKDVHGYVPKRSRAKRAINTTVTSEGGSTEHPVVNGPSAVLGTQVSSSSSSAPAFQMAPNTPVLDYTQLFATGQGNFQAAVNLPVQPIPQLPSYEASGMTLDDLLAAFSYSQMPTNAFPVVPTSTTVYKDPLPSLTLPSNIINDGFLSSSGLRLDDYSYTVDTVPVVSGSQLVSDGDLTTSIPSGGDFNLGCDHYGSENSPWSFDAQAFENHFFAPLGMGAHHQDGVGDITLV